jgi:hypothetical protein
LSQFAPWIILVGALIFALSLWIVIRASNQARQGAFYFMRTDALQRARRWLLMGTAILILSISVGVILSNSPQPVAIANVTPLTATRIISPTKTSTPSPMPTSTSTSTASPTPVISSTVTPTIKPGSVPNLLLTPLPSAVPVAPGAKFTLTTLASVLDSKQSPVDGGTVFPQGTRAIHIFFRTSGVNNAARWAVFCTKGNQLVDSFIDLWKWGPIAQGAHAVCSIDGSIGAYTVTSYLDFNKQFVAPFTIIVPPTPTATPAPTTAP